MRLALIVPMFAALTLVSASGRAAETKSVTIDGLTFQPAMLIVKQGDTVVWNNVDLYAHTVTDQEGTFDSKTIAPNGSWKFVAKKKGSFTYICTLHPVMQGTLVVK